MPHDHAVAVPVSQELQWSPATLALPIATPADYVAATDFLKTVKTFQKRVTEFFKPLKDKAKATHQALCDEEKKALAPALDDEARAKAALVAWDREEERKRQAEERRLAEEARKVEEERRLAEAAALEAEAIESGDDALLAAAQEIVSAPVSAPVIVLPTERPKVAGISYRDVWKFRILDPNLIPRQYLTPNEQAIGAVVRAMKAAAQIPGIEVYTERVASASGR